MHVLSNFVVFQLLGEFFLSFSVLSWEFLDKISGIVKMESGYTVHSVHVYDW